LSTTTHHFKDAILAFNWRKQYKVAMTETEVHPLAISAGVCSLLEKSQILIKVNSEYKLISLKKKNKGFTSKFSFSKYSIHLRFEQTRLLLC
jgi:hypothetical protein